MNSLFALLLLLAPAAAATEGTAAGIQWTVPAGWTAGASRPMRVATYAIPARSGGAAGECAVFHFGLGRGGGVEENISRWAGQFEGSPAPVRRDETIGGFRVHRVAIAGTYLSPGGMRMESQGKLPGYRLLGAIVEAPQGPVFFKCTGPAATLTAAEKPFDGMLRSVSRAKTKSF
jgi:hypothetical protein